MEKEDADRQEAWAEVSKEKGSADFVTEEDMGHQQVGLRLLKFQNILGWIQLLKPLCLLFVFCFLTFIDFTFNFFFFFTVLGLCCFARAFSSCSQRRLLSSCGAKVSHCSSFSW